MKNIIECTAQYKIGHQHVKVPMVILSRNIIRIEKLAEEIPEFLEGINTRLQIFTGEFVPILEKYDDVRAAYIESLKDWD